VSRPGYWEELERPGPDAVVVEGVGCDEAAGSGWRRGGAEEMSSISRWRAAAP
jgi:hypothetical protein